MNSLVETQETFFFSSDSNLGAQNKDLNGSRFQVRLNTPISIPSSAIDVSIECIAANIWYTSPNIAEEYKNNILYLEYNSTTIPITLPDGLYASDTLNAYVKRALGKITKPGDTSKFAESSIKIFENPASQKIVFALAAGLTLDATSGPNNVSQTLGFTTSVTSTYSGESFEGDEIAQLNRINGYLLHSDIVQDGISINSQYDSILTEVQLTAEPGKLLNYRPYIPYKVSGKHLKYGNKDLLTFYLTDEQNRPIDTFGENYSFTIVIRYKMRENASMLRLNVPHIN